MPLQATFHPIPMDIDDPMLPILPEKLPPRGLKRGLEGNTGAQSVPLIKKHIRENASTNEPEPSPPPKHIRENVSTALSLPSVSERTFLIIQR